MDGLITDYQHLSDLTGRMRAAATDGAWDELIALGELCTQQAARIRQRDGIPADEPVRQLKATLIRKMLADDKAIREQTEPWMRQLQQIMQSARSERNLQRSYLAQG